MWSLEAVVCDTLEGGFLLRWWSSGQVIKKTITHLEEDGAVKAEPRVSVYGRHVRDAVHVCLVWGDQRDLRIPS